MESKHTPGPWKVNAHGDRVVEVAGNRDDIVILGNNYENVSPSQTVDATLALIAAAPDMYEALKTVRLVFPEHPSTLHNPTRVMVESVLAALAKAEGR